MVSKSEILSRIDWTCIFGNYLFSFFIIYLLFIHLLSNSSVQFHRGNEFPMKDGDYFLYWFLSNIQKPASMKLVSSSFIIGFRFSSKFPKNWRFWRLFLNHITTCCKTGEIEIILLLNLQKNTISDFFPDFITSRSHYLWIIIINILSIFE